MCQSAVQASWPRLAMQHASAMRVSNLPLLRVRADVEGPRDDLGRGPRRSITFKKTAHAEEQQRADVQSRRREWFAGQLDLDPTKLARKGGRCRRGRRLRAAIPHSHDKR